jgi:hypothetical protein
MKDSFLIEEEDLLASHVKHVVCYHVSLEDPYDLLMEEVLFEDHEEEVCYPFLEDL